MGKLVLANAYLAVWTSRYIAIDNVFTKELYEKKFRRKFEFISFGSEIQDAKETGILEKLSLKKVRILFIRGPVHSRQRTAISYSGL